VNNRDFKGLLTAKHQKIKLRAVETDTKFNGEIIKVIKRISSIPIALSLCISCGKEITSSSKEDKVVKQEPLTSNSISLKVNYDAQESSSNMVQFKLEQSGWAKIPLPPKVIAGDAQFLESRIYFNVSINPDQPNNQNLYCHYKSSKVMADDDLRVESAYEHTFVGCYEDVDKDGSHEEINYYVGDEVPVDAGNFIIFKVYPKKGSDKNIQVHSLIELD